MINNEKKLISDHSIHRIKYNYMILPSIVNIVNMTLNLTIK